MDRLHEGTAASSPAQLHLMIPTPPGHPSFQLKALDSGTLTHSLFCSPSFIPAHVQRGWSPCLAPNACAQLHSHHGENLPVPSIRVPTPISSGFPSRRPHGLPRSPVTQPPASPCPEPLSPFPPRRWLLPVSFPKCCVVRPRKSARTYAL